MKANSIFTLMILLCCLPGPQVILGFQEEQDPEGKQEVLGEKVEEKADVGNPVIADPHVRDRDKDDSPGDYEKAGGYEDQEKDAGKLEAVLAAKEEDDKVQLDSIEAAGADQPKKHYRFAHGFAASISVIIVSEIGDKTFFIAAIMAMKHSRYLVFGGAISALGLMTVLSVCLGFATMIIPRSITFYISTALLALFGFKMLYEGYNMDPNEGQEELEEVTEELRKREESLLQGTSSDPEQGLAKVPLRRRLKCFGPFVSAIFLQSFSLTFLAEWGDRSQLTTIILGARENPLGVILGGTLGHALCTALAVLGGKMLAQRISLKTVTLIGGAVFLLFAVTAMFHAPVSD